MRTGILLALIGLWVVMRTTNRDATGRTLADRILGKGADNAPASTTPAAPSQQPAAAPGGPSGPLAGYPDNHGGPAAPSGPSGPLAGYPDSHGGH